MKKISIKLAYIIVFILLILTNNSQVNAMEDYGVYCEYGFYDEVLQRDSYISIKLVVDSNSSKVEFDRGILEGDVARHDLETVFGVSLESGRPNVTDNSIANDEILNWLKEKGFVDENDNFSCPTNPYSAELQARGYGNLGEPIVEECNDSGCGIGLLPSAAWEPFTCNYVSQSTYKSLVIKFLLDENSGQARWEITYPDRTSKVYTGFSPIVDGNWLPGNDCSDIFYATNEKKIKVGLNTVLTGLCDIDSDIEHFCSGGTCTEETWTCPAADDSGACPSELKPIFVFIKKAVMNTLQIFIPILLIVMGTIDLVKATMAMDDKGMKEATSKLIKRVIAAVLVFFVTTIVVIIMDMFASTDIGAQDDWKACWLDLD